MTQKPALRALTIAALLAAMTSGCARMPMGPQAGLPAQRAGNILAKAAPVSGSALAVARKWNANAFQVGASIVKADATDDVATYIYAAPGKTDAMLIVISAESIGLKAQELPVSGRVAESLGKMASLAGFEDKLADSKVLFRAAEAAGVAGARDMVVMAPRDHAKGIVPMVTVSGDDSYVVLDAATGKVLSAVNKLSADRRVQAHELALAVVIVGTVGTAVVWGAKKLIAKYWKPKTKPSPEPSAAPSAEPAPVLTPPPGDEV